MVLDASVAIAALMADGRARWVLTHADDVTFHAPAALWDEIERTMPRIAARAGVAAGAMDLVLDELRERVIVLPSLLLAATIAEAEALCREADAVGDEAYVAAALALDAPVWTYDHDFRRVADIRVVGTGDLVRDDP